MFIVAPYAGAWIEMLMPTSNKQMELVAPYAGAWIEMEKWKRSRKAYVVAPYAGAWIEIQENLDYILKQGSRSLCGGVD